MNYCDLLLHTRQPLTIIRVLSTFNASNISPLVALRLVCLFGNSWRTRSAPRRGTRAFRGRMASRRRCDGVAARARPTHTLGSRALSQFRGVCVHISAQNVHVICAPPKAERGW